MFSKFVSNFGFQVTTYKPPLHMLNRCIPMSSTQSQGSCIAFRTPQPEQYYKTMSRPAGSGECVSPAFMDKEALEMLKRFSEQFNLEEIGISQEEIDELRVFDEFLTEHVRPNGLYDVQCMLLWSEWVRAYRRQITGFPKLIREKEFRSAVSDTFGVAVAKDEIRGVVFPGLRFNP